jgi:hypothetical protein
MTYTVPNLGRSLVDEDRKVGSQSEWVAWFTQFSTPPKPVINLLPDVIASPFKYVAKEPGNIIIIGGGGAGVVLRRGTAAVGFNYGQLIIPVELKDSIEIIYTTKPTTVQFWSRY